jgi:hypothetical protein
VLVAVCTIALSAAGGASAQSLPPLPKCLGVGGPCDGIILKSPGPPIQRVTDVDRTGLVKLEAPAAATGADLKAPTACGVEQCVYNHYDWYSTAGVVRGCVSNHPTCVVRPPRGGNKWTLVLVNLDDYPVMVYLLYAPPPGKVVLSGTVVKRECSENQAIGGCGLQSTHAVPASGETVRVSGAGGTARTKTRHDGTYGFVVARGHHVIRVDEHGKGAVDPRSRALDARSDQNGLDFALCKNPESSSNLPDCGLVEIDGNVYDEFGGAFANADIEGPDGETARTDVNGAFTIWAPRGSAEVTASSLPAQVAKTVHAVKDVNRTFFTLKPTIVASSISDLAFQFQVGGLPNIWPSTSLTLEAKRFQPVLDARCVDDQSMTLTPRLDHDPHRGTAEFLPGGIETFCSKDPYTATLRDPHGEMVATTTFTVP